MERGRHENGDQYYFQHHQDVDRLSPERMPLKSTISSSSSARSGTPLLPPSCSLVGGVSYIEHKVSKMDTLAGIAIKYGVEVADIKRMNGLVTDLQMFALKSLHIPLPGRHPPSPCLSNDSDSQGPCSTEETPARRRHSDLFESFPSLKMDASPSPRVSPAMSDLQGYYGLKTPDKKPKSEGFEMAVYREGGSQYLEDGPFDQPSPLSNPPLSHHRKSKSVENGFFSNNNEVGDGVAITESREGDSDKWYKKLIRRRQKSEADFISHTPEALPKEDNSSSSSSGGFLSITGKDLTLRPKAAGLIKNLISLNWVDSPIADSVNVVRRSSSTSSLHDQENGASSSSSSSSMWLTPKWKLKPDLQALSTAAITRPIFDGLPKPLSGRRNKAALD